MKEQAYAQTIERKKIVVIWALFVASVVIVILGASLSIFSLANKIGFTVLNSHIHGAIFGLVVTFLGIRYFFSVRRLKAEVYKTTSKFSWSNFRREKGDRSVLKSR